MLQSVTARFDALNREEQIVETFVGLADTMVDDFDVIEFLHRLVANSVDLLACAEVGLLLGDAAGNLRVMASSSENSQSLELLQSQNDEGPCFECYHQGRAMSVVDLTVGTDRWPGFAAAALKLGVLSVHAIPMRVRDETIGALNLFRSEIGSLPERDVPLGQGMADIAAVALMQERAVRETRGVTHQLQGALNSRVQIEQAKGVLAERADVGVDAAFAKLRAYSRAHNQRLSDVARDLVEGRLDPAALIELSAPKPR